MWPNPKETVDLVTFTEGILNGKLHFLCSNKKHLLIILHNKPKEICYVNSFRSFYKSFQYILSIPSFGQWIVNYNWFGFLRLSIHVVCCSNFTSDNTNFFSICIIWNFMVIKSVSEILYNMEKQFGNGTLFL